MSLLTQKALGESLKKLLRSKPLDKITVKDITDDCGVNRQTFYYHFHDVYELLEWVFMMQRRMFLGSMENEKDWRAVIRGLLGMLLEEKDFIIHAFQSADRKQVEDFAKSLGKPTLVTIVEQYAEGMDMSGEDIEFLVNMFAMALVGIIMQWVEDGMPQHFEDDLDRFYKFLEGSLQGVLEEFKR